MLDEMSLNWNENDFDGADEGQSAGTVIGNMSGIAKGTRVATAIGWQPIEAVSVGDAVLTFDNGLRTVKAIRREALWLGQGSCPREARPLHVPAGVLGNREAMILLPRQGVVVESDSAEDETGDPFALVRADALEGLCGITRFVPEARIEVFVLQFEEDEVVFTANGGLCICPAAGDMLRRLFRPETGNDYRLLSWENDAELISDILFEIEDAFIERTRGATEENARVAELVRVV